MIVLFFLSALFAEIVGTLAGFGSSTVFLPLALLFFDFRTALTLVAFFHIFGNATRIGFFLCGCAAVSAVLLAALRYPFFCQRCFLQQNFLRYLPVLFVVAIGGSFTGKSI